MDEKLQNSEDWQGRRVYVVGAGKSGLAALNWCLKRGACLCLNDRRPREQFDAGLLNRLKEAGVTLALGKEPDPLAFKAELIAVSPGVPLDKPGLEAAARQGIPFTNEIELGYLSARGPILAVTGSNGKTTVTSLLGQILQAKYPDVFVGGNIGRPFAEAAARMAEGQPAVLELSSFQLETVRTFRPRVAVILNLTPDHLDRHKTFENYCAAKWRITENQGRGDWLILNYEDPLLRRAGLEMLDRQSREDAAEGPGIPQIVFFSCGQRPPQGLWLQESREVMLCRGPRAEKLFSARDFSLPGAHNLANLLAASAAALALGLQPEIIQKRALAFRPLEHRLEPVAEIGGVRYVNDSKATNIDAALKALDSFREPVVLIAGGRGKGAPYEPLARKIAAKATWAVLMGEEADSIAEALLAAGFTAISRARDLTEAVAAARDKARPGQTVLLAPACDSHDMFNNFEDRGRQFKAAVRQLAAEGEGKCSS